MKRILKVFFVVVLMIGLVGCETPKEEGMAKIPYESSSAKGKMLDEVQKDLNKAGFTNVEVEPIDDLILGWLTKDQEVEKVLVDGSDEYHSGKYFKEDIPVVVYYHTFNEDEEVSEEESTVTSSPEETSEEEPTVTSSPEEVIEDEVLTMENSDELYELTHRVFYEDEQPSIDLAKNLIGKKVEMKMMVIFVENYQTYKTRFNYCFAPVDGEECELGAMPYMVKNVNYNGLHLVNDDDSFAVGDLGNVIATIESVDEDMIYLNLESIETIK